MTEELFERMIAALERIAAVLDPNPNPEAQPEPEVQWSDVERMATTALHSGRIVRMHKPGTVPVFGVVESIDRRSPLTIHVRTSPQTLRHWRWQPGDTISICVCDAPDLYCDVHDG